MVRSSSLFSNKAFIALALVLILTSNAVMGASTGSGSDSGMYVGIPEPMIVNVLSHDSIHFLQVTAEFKLKDANMAEVVELHMAPIKHHLMMMLSEKKFYELQSVEGKRKLREEALELIQQVLKERTGDTTIENIFFTSLMVQ